MTQNTTSNYFVIGLFYLVFWCAFDLVGWVFEVSPGVSPWYPPHGLSIALLLILGLQFLPLLMVGPLIMGSLVWMKGEPVALLLLALGVTLGYGCSALWLRRRDVDPGLGKLSDVAQFFAAMIVGSLAVATMAILDLAVFGLLSWDAVPSSILSFWAGDTLGVICIAPALMTTVFPKIRQIADNWQRDTAPRLFGSASRLTKVLFIALALLIVAVLDPFDAVSFSLSFLLVFPVLGIAMTGSVAATATAVAAASIAMAAALKTNNGLDYLVAEQLLMSGLAIGALCLAAAVSELRTTRKLLVDVFDTTTEGILAFDSSGRVRLANKAARRMLGGVEDKEPFDWPEDVRFSALDVNETDTAGANPIKRLLEGAAQHSGVNVLTRRGEREHRYVRINSARSNDESSAIWSVLALNDVTEIEEGRQQIERANRLDALGQLTGGIAHDFNNLLSTIEYGTELSKTTENSEQRQTYHDTVLSAVRKGAVLTSRLLAFAKRQPGRAASVLVSQVLDDLEQLAKPTIEESIDLMVSCSDPELLVYCDIGQLESALLNLVINARDALVTQGVGGRITVSARGVSDVDADLGRRRENLSAYIAQGLSAANCGERGTVNRTHRFVELVVTDNGTGMSDRVKARATDPFFSTKASGAGTGLGLSMVYGFVQQSDGDMRIYSEPGLGTTVRITLPRGSEAGPREEPVDQLPVSKGQGEVVLIVEDRRELLDMMGDVIGQLGYEVLKAPDGTAALETVMSGTKIDLLLTDVVMPGAINGFELAERTRAVLPELPVVYMSGYTGYSSADMGSVVAPILQKPGTPMDLARTIRDALGSSGGAATSAR
ncbi:ATP-binding protein [Sulfitobacter sp. D35]|uniref:ATP-binding protein n=1 Tax=Sulfitobacter sp. D35 TaxID=3083252 RepID=UPI00296F0537|nr:ATP-binding protein [Sulfitobacter sp. D35]MDW4498695.1 ATP-binding protein [Sulfitobacter sp. D35]